MQTLFAFQQLTMERYNDALAWASGAQLGGETVHQYFQSEARPELIEQYVLPAVDLKLEVIGRMIQSHRETARPTNPQLAKVYDACTKMLGVMWKRAEAQGAGWKKWLSEPPVDTVENRQLDREELAATDAVIKSINEVIFKKLKLDPTAFLEINAQATNHVRANLRLESLTQEEYVLRYMLGLQGQPVRFYS